MEFHVSSFQSVINSVCQTHSCAHTKEKSIPDNRANALHNIRWKVNIQKLFIYSCLALSVRKT